MKLIYKLSIVLIFMSFILTPINIGMGQNTTQTKPNAGITLNVITRHASDVFKPFRDAFLASDLAKNAGVTNVVFWSKVESEWINEVKSNYYDVAWGGGPTLFDQLNQRNLLVPMSDTGVLNEASNINETISGVPLKRYNVTCTGPCGDPTWIAAAISSFGFTVNHDVLDANNLAVPRTWADLANISYYSSTKPLVAIGNAPDTTSNTRVYEIILQAFGWDAGWSLISAMAGNSEILPGSTEVLNAVILGEVAISLTIDFYGYQAQSLNPSTEYIIPEGQSIVNGDPIALLDGPSANRVGANAFIQFVLSQEGQTLWLDKNINRLPARADVFSTPEGQTRQDLKNAFELAENNKGIDFNDTLALSHSETTLSYFQTALTDVQTELHDGWGKIVGAYKSGSITRDTISNWIYSFGYPAISQAEAIKYNSQANNVTLLNQIRADMKDQYTSVGSQASKANPTSPKTSPVDYFYVPVQNTSTTTTTTNTGSISTTSKKAPISPGFEVFSALAILPIIMIIKKRKLR